MPSLEILQTRIVTREADSAALSQLVVQRRQAAQIRRNRARQVIETSAAGEGSLDNASANLKHEADAREALHDHLVDKRA